MNNVNIEKLNWPRAVILKVNESETAGLLMQSFKNTALLMLLDYLMNFLKAMLSSRREFKYMSSQDVWLYGIYQMYVIFLLNRSTGYVDIKH